MFNTYKKMEQIQNSSKNKYRKYKNRNKKQIQNENLTNVCSLCKDNPVEISMVCSGMHSYCFTCVKKWLITKKELSCPECRKICDNVIKIQNDKEKLSTEFLKFLESTKIIPNPLKHDEECKCFHTYFDNTCIYPNWSIIHFIENKEQLELYYESVENPKYKDNKDLLVKVIKWVIVEEDDKHTHNH